MIRWLRAFFLTAFSSQFIKHTILIIFVLSLLIYAVFTNNDKENIVTSQPNPTVANISAAEHLKLAKIILVMAMRQIKIQ